MRKIQQIMAAPGTTQSSARRAAQHKQKAKNRAKAKQARKQRKRSKH